MAKLTQEELNSIKTLQQSYNSLIFNLGRAEMNLNYLEEQFKLYKEEKTRYIKELAELEKTEKLVTDELQQKYGSGNIDVNTGEITPVQS